METGNKWFKFYGQDWLTDLKVMRLSLEDRLCYITLLCLASASSEQGVVHDCDEEAVIQLTHLRDNPLDDDNEYTRAQGCLKRFEEKGMVTVLENGDVSINAFAKRQNSFLTGAERQAKFREKQGQSYESNAKPVTKVTLEKSREEKNRKEKREKSPDATISYLKNLPEEDLKEFTYRFDASPKQVQSKAEDLFNYCQAKGKVYKNYRAFLINALKKDFKEMTDEERERRKVLDERVRATRERQGSPVEVVEGRPLTKDMSQSISNLKSKMTLKRV